MKALMHTLNDADGDLIRETERARMAELDEDALVDLHKRVRRARNKYVKRYRREAAGNVQEKGSRGKARPKGKHNAAKAEVFEDALSRVSRQLAATARRSAQDLRAERLTAARGASSPAGPARASAPRTAKKASARKAASPTVDRDARPRTPASTKRVASSRATGARRQARRDSRSGS
jgi:NADH dehydrogenase/NADH:ubiquinone oxidoreductase subunit G